MNILSETLIQPSTVMLQIASDHLDAGNVGTFKQLIQPYLDENQVVLVDMSQLDFVDSSGLGVITSYSIHYTKLYESFRGKIACATC